MQRRRRRCVVWWLWDDLSSSNSRFPSHFSFGVGKITMASLRDSVERVRSARLMVIALAPTQMPEQKCTNSWKFEKLLVLWYFTVPSLSLSSACDSSCSGCGDEREGEASDDGL